jgi:hypothetical protein
MIMLRRHVGLQRYFCDSAWLNGNEYGNDHFRYGPRQVKATRQPLRAGFRLQGQATCRPLGSSASHDFFRLNGVSISSSVPQYSNDLVEQVRRETWFDEEPFATFLAYDRLTI